MGFVFVLVFRVCLSVGLFVVSVRGDWIGFLWLVMVCFGFEGLCLGFVVGVFSTGCCVFRLVWGCLYVFGLVVLFWIS